MKIVNPKYAMVLSAYKDPKSDTFGDIVNSALNAGFSINYAKSITTNRPDWFTTGIIDNVKVIKRAESNLKRYLDIDVPLDDIDLAKLQVDVSKFVLKNLASGKYTDKQTEVNNSFQINMVNYADMEAKAVEVLGNESPTHDSKE